MATRACSLRSLRRSASASESPQVFFTSASRSFDCGNPPRKASISLARMARAAGCVGSFSTARMYAESAIAGRFCEMYRSPSMYRLSGVDLPMASTASRLTDASTGCFSST